MLGHHGPVLFYRFKGGRDIAGLTVVTVHRMLKNSIAGTRYVALSGPACTVPLALGPREDTVESYPDVGELTIAVQRFDPAPWLAAASGAAAKPAGRLRSLIGRITGR